MSDGAHDKAVFLACCDTLTHRPQDLSDDQITILAECRPELALTAKAARTRAHDRIEAKRYEQQQRDERRAVRYMPPPRAARSLDPHTLAAVVVEGVRPIVTRLNALDARTTAIEASALGTRSVSGDALIEQIMRVCQQRRQRTIFAMTQAGHPADEVEAVIALDKAIVAEALPGIVATLREQLQQFADEAAAPIDAFGALAPHLDVLM